MDYSRRDLVDRLASEYALGTLRGGARRRFETLMQAHPALRRGVAQWQERLAPLTISLPPVEPPAKVWRSIESRLFAPSTPARKSRWQSLGLWRGLTGAMTAAALGLVLISTAPAPAQAPILVVLASNPGAAAQSASFVVSVSGDGKALVLKPLQGLSISADRTLELWSVPGQGNPRSLGLVQAAGTTTLVRAQFLRDTAAFAVSIEPAGGSTTGTPTGPIVSIGKLEI